MRPEGEPIAGAAVLLVFTTYMNECETKGRVSGVEKTALPDGQIHVLVAPHKRDNYPNSKRDSLLAPPDNADFLSPCWMVLYEFMTQE